MSHPLQDLCPIPLTLTWHENRSSYLSFRKTRTHLHLRLHRLFEEAPSPVLEALIQFAIHRDLKARTLIKQMAHLYFSENRVPADLVTQKGTTYDLQEIYTRMQSLLPVSDIRIGWARIRKVSGRFRSLTFGTYDPYRHQIRIHPILDHPEVPLYFLEFIVYHEMLHAVCKSRVAADGRCRIHTREFREKERQFPQYEVAKAWEKQSLKFFKRRISHGRA
jgi:hypothetical protein